MNRYLRLFLKYTFPLIALIGILGVSACAEGSPYPESMWTRDIYPGATLTFDLGSPTYMWHNLYVENINGVLSGNVTGTGIPGQLVQWVGASIIANATNTDVEVANAVGAAHTQNTDTILTIDGVTQLINAGLVVHDIETDRWLHSLTNTFFGVGAAGAGNLAHTGGNEGYSNTGIGTDALSSIRTGYNNTAIGENAGEGITTGYYNTVIGSTAGQFIDIAYWNTAVGYQALMTGTGIGNTAIGLGAMGQPDDANYSTAVGMQSLNEGEGDRNVALGRWAGKTCTGDDNVFLGTDAGKNSGAVSDKLYIDNSDIATPLIYGDFSTNDIIINGDLTANGNFNYGADVGASDTYACTITGITAYATGMSIYFQANTANTGACTINVNTLGAIPLKIKGNSADPEDNWILSGEIVHCVYDGTNFQILNPDSTP